MSAKERDKPLHLFAWQGVQVTVPDTWNARTLEGDRRRGYCALEDDVTVRLEARWEPARSAKAATRAVDSYLAVITRDARKANADLRVKRDTQLVAVDDAESETFECRGYVDEVGLAVRCRRCRRLTVVRVRGRRDEALAGTAAAVLRSFRDHDEGGVLPWSVYGFGFALPTAYRLGSHQLAAGRIDLAFTASRRTARTLRVGLAGLVLGGRSLKAWAEKDVRKRLRWKRADLTTATWQGRDAIETRRRRRFPASLLLGGQVTRYRAWHCPEDNAVYAFSWSGRPQAEAEFEDFVASLRH